MKLKETLNLGKTAFPMRAGLPNKEPIWQKEWEDAKMYQRRQELNEGKPHFTLHDGPPYANGNIHVGHAMNKISKDIIVRSKSMSGFYAPYVPGWDTHGLPIEQVLAKQGVKRKELDRAEYLKMCRDYALSQVDKQREDFKRLGVSADWDNPYVTLTPDYEAAQIRVFGEMAKKGYIYQGAKPVYWSWSSESALAEAEIEYHDLVSTSLYYANKVKDGKGVLDTDTYIVVWTTTPFTVTASRGLTVGADIEYVLVKPAGENRKFVVASELLNSLSEKFGWTDVEVLQSYRGEELNQIVTEHPWDTEVDELVILGDHVTTDSGTGIVHTAPGFGEDDYNVGIANGLEVAVTVNERGIMMENAGPDFEGQFYDKVAPIVMEKLGDLLLAKEEISHSYPFDWRTKKPIIWRAVPQWFASVSKFRQEILDEIEKVKFHSEWGKVRLYNMIRDRGDWVISRQLWWGHQIPAWYNAEGEMYVGEEAPEGDGWKQDEDVLDTWFSSALWPFSTMGWPDVDSEDFKRYFPTSTLVTGYDIIFFWVSRMIFQSLEFTGRQPFKNVLIHGLIRDEQGRKMSKSLGNGIDPMDVIDKYGTDSLRWFLSNGSAPGQDVRFSYEKMDASWNFINKIWNISRYILMNNEGLTLDAARENVAKVAAGQAGNVTDRWILHNLNETIGKVTENFDKFEFGVAGHILYNFIWDEFADWYVELTKEVLYSDNEDEKVITRSVLLYTLDQILRLLHPIMPFVTEEIYGQISEGTIVTAEYPVVRPEFENEESAAGVEALKDVIRSVRNSRAEVNVAPSKPITILVKTSDSDLEAFFNSNVNYIKRFTNPEHLEIAADVEVPDLVMSSIITGAEIYLPLADLLNVEEELARLEKELAKWQKELDMVGKKLSNERFVANAKPEVVQKERDKQEDYQAKYDATVVRIEEMKKLVK